MKLGVLFSGGKDSTYALYKAKQKNEIACLITIISRNPESYMFHTPNIELVDLQAKALGFPLIKKVTKGEKEKELKDLKAAIVESKKKFAIQGIVTGAFASVYQRDRIRNICDELSLECINPLWGQEPEKMMQEMIASGFKFMLSSIAALGLDESWLGRVLTDNDIDKLVELNKKFGVHIAFEGGEAESLVIDGPIFKQKINIIRAEKKMENENTGIYRIIKAELA
jgi:asparagine synthase (glutamine-hydrolysing)